MVSQYIAAARILETFIGMPYLWAIISFAVITGVYTCIGGIRGVAYNTLLQGFVMLGGSVIIAVIMVNASGGLSEITLHFAQIDPNLVTPPGPKNFLPLTTAFSTFLSSAFRMAQPLCHQDFQPSRTWSRNVQSPHSADHPGWFMSCL